MSVNLGAGIFAILMKEMKGVCWGYFCYVMKVLEEKGCFVFTSDRDCACVRS